MQFYGRGKLERDYGQWPGEVPNERDDKDRENRGADGGDIGVRRSANGVGQQWEPRGKGEGAGPEGQYDFESVRGDAS